MRRNGLTLVADVLWERGSRCGASSYSLWCRKRDGPRGSGLMAISNGWTCHSKILPFSMFPEEAWNQKSGRSLISATHLIYRLGLLFHSG